ncbi:MAG: hypothetical protein ABSG19_12515 [Candidatus Aminicenantales bacterium]
MESDLKNPREDELQTLIREDQDRALADFRTGNFEVRVRARIAETEKEPRMRPFFLRGIPAHSVPMALVIVAAVAAAAIMFWPRRPSPLLTVNDVRALWTALEWSPGVKVLSGPGTSAAAGPGRQSGPPSSFERTLRLLQAQGQAQENEAGPGLTEKPAPPLSFRDKVRILYRDKVIERALLLAIEKSKEV